MDRNTTIAFILIGAILVLWFYLNTPSPEEVQKGKTADTTAVHLDTAKVKRRRRKLQLIQYR